MCDMRTKKMKKEEYKEEEDEVQVLVDTERRERLPKKYSFFVTNRVGNAIFDTGILLATKDETWMAGEWVVLSARSLASSFPFQPGHRRWPYANTDPTCLIHVNGLKAKRIFQAFSLFQGIMWEELRLGTCICTLKKVFFCRNY